MAKRSNNSLGRRSYGGKPYDANNSFVKKMATKVTDLIPQRSWISKWFNSSEDNRETVDKEDSIADDTEEEIQPPASKRPRIRMDITHPPGTFSICSNRRALLNDSHSRKDPFSHINETGEDFLEPPVAGPSGVRRLVSSTPSVPNDMRNSNSLIPSRNSGASNGADDNSESSESTSGCSSLIPQTNRQEASTISAYNSNSESRKRMTEKKLSVGKHVESLRCLFLENGNRESLSSRRPSFNPSMMSNTQDRTFSHASPFYAGNVTFGGANAISHYKLSHSLFNSSNEFQLKVPRRTSVQVKPSKSECIDSSGMSQTAKRILEAMEYFSSPISDAKKIPMKNATGTTSGRKRLRDEQIQGATARVGLRHLTRELSVPTVPDMLKLRRRQKLQDTTVAARKIVSAMGGPPTASTNRPSVPQAHEYHLRTERDENPKFHGKLRAKLKKTSEDEAPSPIVNLPRITLPITTLPSFESLPKYTKPPSIGITTDTYKFATPIKIREAAWNLKSINNFSFSKPLNPEDDKEPNENREFTCISKNASVNSESSTFGSLDGAATNFIWTNSSTAPRLKVKTKAKEKESNELTNESSGHKSGSVMDILGSKTCTGRATETAEIWECGDCYIKNDSNEKMCVACKASRPNAADNKISSAASSVSSNVTPAQSRSEGFASQFNTSGNKWECPSCLVRNQETESACVCCTTPKPTNKTAASTEPLISTSSTSTKSNLMNKFKSPEGTWECPGCMLRNPSAVITCPCCKAAKPSSLKIITSKASTAKASESKSFGLMDKFKPSTSTWECSSCMVRNNETASCCVCCTNPKTPGASQKSDESAKSTAQPIATSGWGEKFKKPKDSWSCDSCMLQNKSEVNECVACGGLKPGGTAKPTVSQFSFGVPANSQNFSFGIDKANVKPKGTDQVSSNGFSFGVKPSSVDNDTAANKFTFGIPKENETTGKSMESAPKPAGFVFAAPKTADGNAFKFEAGAKNVANAETTKNDEKKAPAATFSFGLPKTVDETNRGSENKMNFGDSTSVANGKPNITFGIKSQGNTADADKSAPKVTFDVPSGDTTVQKSLDSATEISQSSSSKETERSEIFSKKSGTSGSEEPASTISSSFTTLNPTVTSNLPGENHASFTFSVPKSKLTSDTSIVPRFGQNSVATPSAYSTFATATPETNDITSAAASASPFAIGSSSSTSTSLAETPLEAKSTTSTSFGTVEKKPSFFEMAGGDKKPSTFGTPENKLSATFGSSGKSTNSPMFNSPPPAFGTPATAASQPLFGNNSATPLFGSSFGPSFGTTGASSETPSIFAAAKPSVTPIPANPGLFSFDPATSQPTASPSPATNAFSFTGNVTPAVSASKSLFGFGGTAATGAPNVQSNDCFGTAGTSTSGTFGTPAATNPSPSPFTFNPPGKQNPPSFGQATGPISSIFGTQPTVSSVGQAQNLQPVSTGFNFGAVAPTPEPGVFSFGGGMSQPSNASSSGYNFNAPAPSTAASFDPNTRPSFNFTGGTAPTAFNATPQPATTRKIKKAVRRMPQR